MELLGHPFRIAVLFLLVNPERGAKLLATGNVTFGKIVGTEWVGNVEGELRWCLDYKFRDS